MKAYNKVIDKPSDKLYKPLNRPSRDKQLTKEELQALAFDSRTQSRLTSSQHSSMGNFRDSTHPSTAATRDNPS